MSQTTKKIIRENNKYIAGIHVFGMLFFKDKKTGNRSKLLLGKDFSQVNELSNDKFNFIAQKAIEESN